jgi:hypothetical protein
MKYDAECPPHVKAVAKATQPCCQSEEARLEGALRALEAEAARPLLRVHPGKVASYLANLRATLAKGGTRARAVVQEDIEKVIVHSVRSETAKPSARAEVIATGKGLLSGVVLVVAGAGYPECYTAPMTYWIERL